MKTKLMELLRWDNSRSKKIAIVLLALAMLLLAFAAVSANVERRDTQRGIKNAIGIWERQAYTNLQFLSQAHLGSLSDQPPDTAQLLQLMQSAAGLNVLLQLNGQQDEALAVQSLMRFLLQSSDTLPGHLYELTNIFYDIKETGNLEAYAALADYMQRATGGDYAEIVAQ